VGRLGASAWSYRDRVFAIDEDGTRSFEVGDRPLIRSRTQLCSIRER
jgi:hypothetical protein